MPDGFAFDPQAPRRFGDRHLLGGQVEEGFRFVLQPESRHGCASQPAEALAAARSVVPSKPHPRAPDTPPGNLVAAAVAKPLDAAAGAASKATRRVRRAATG